MKTYYSLDSIDKILEEKFLDYDNGYFIELGGNDGVTQSNTYYFEKFRGWHGLLIEPILHQYFKCKNNRQRRPNPTSPPMRRTYLSAPLQASGILGKKTSRMKWMR